MDDAHYKALLFEVLGYLAHQEDGGADQRVMQWLLVLEHRATVRGDVADQQAARLSIEHLALQQAFRQMERASGRSDG